MLQYYISLEGIVFIILNKMLANKISDLARKYLHDKIFPQKVHNIMISCVPKSLYNHHQRYIKTALVLKVETFSNNVKIYLLKILQDNIFNICISIYLGISSHWISNTYIFYFKNLKFNLGFCSSKKRYCIYIK